MPERKGFHESFPQQEADFLSTVNELFALYKVKNRRYQNSFAEQFAEDGVMTASIRLMDKVKRFKHLSNNSEDEGGDESIEDTLKDLANYSIMTLMAIRSQKGE